MTTPKKSTYQPSEYEQETREIVLKLCSIVKEIVETLAGQTTDLDSLMEAELAALEAKPRRRKAAATGRRKR